MTAHTSSQHGSTVLSARPRPGSALLDAVELLGA